MFYSIQVENTTIGMTSYKRHASLHHRIETTTEARLLGFSYDFGVTVIRHQNADAMVLASALMKGIHPLLIFKMVDVQGECPSQAHWLGPWRQHFDDGIMV